MPGSIAQVSPDILKLIDPMDQTVRGARNIAIVKGLKRANGEPDTRAAHYQLESGLIDADKNGGVWESTPHRILGPRPPGKAERIKEAKKKATLSGVA